MKCFVYLAFLAPVALAVPTESGAHLVGITQSTQTGLAEQGVAAAHGENALELTCPACITTQRAVDATNAAVVNE